MNHPPELYQATANLFALLTPFAYIALHLIRYFFPLP